MNRSSKFNFFLPQNTDPIEVNDFNSNFETIDANLLTKAQNLTEAQKAAVRANADLNVANNLTTAAAGSVLDARQGKALYDLINSRETIANNSNFNSYTIAAGGKDKHYVGTNIGSITNRPSDLASSYQYAFILDAESINGYTVQTLSVYGTSVQMYRRQQYYYNGLNWTNWEKFAKAEEGTWTPSIQRATVSDLVGKYKKIGSLYICTFSFSLSAVQANAPYLNGSSLPGYTSSVFTAAEGSWSSTADEFGAMGNTNNNNIWFSKNNAIYGMSGSVNKTVRGALTYIV